MSRLITLLAGLILQLLLLKASTLGGVLRNIAHHVRQCQDTFKIFKGVFNVALNERLKLLRLQKGVTQRAIANGVGIGEGTVQKFEYGKAKPKLDTLLRLADFFNVSTDYLLGRSNTPARLP